jgi:cell division protein FtsB
MPPNATPRPRPLSGRRLLAILAALACGWAAYSLYGQWAQDRALAAGVARLRSANSALEQQIAERFLQIREAQGSAWIEEQARGLGFHLPGETIYVVVPSGPSVPRSGGIDAAPPTFSPTPAPTPTPASTTPAPLGTPALRTPGSPPTAPSPGG